MIKNAKLVLLVVRVMIIILVTEKLCLNMSLVFAELNESKSNPMALTDA